MTISFSKVSGLLHRYWYRAAPQYKMWGTCTIWVIIVFLLLAVKRKTKIIQIAPVNGDFFVYYG